MEDTLSWSVADTSECTQAIEAGNGRFSRVCAKVRSQSAGQIGREEKIKLQVGVSP
jgi:hypothetical protein